VDIEREKNYFPRSLGVSNAFAQAEALQSQTQTEYQSIDFTIGLSLCNKVDDPFMKISLYCFVVNSHPINFWIGGAIAKH
jgi:hypothetical protein